MRISGPVQTPLHSCAEPNWVWFDFGATLARHLIQTAHRVSNLIFISCREKEGTYGKIYYHNVCIRFGTWEKRRMNHLPPQCQIMRQTLSNLTFLPTKLRLPYQTDSDAALLPYLILQLGWAHEWSGVWTGPQWLFSARRSDESVMHIFPFFVIYFLSFFLSFFIHLQVLVQRWPYT